MRTHFMVAGIQMKEPIQHHTLFEADRVKICQRYNIINILGEQKKQMAAIFTAPDF